MTLPTLTPRARLLLIAGCILLLGGSFLRACYYSGRVHQAIEANPPLPAKQVKVIVAQQKASEKKAAVYQKAAATAVKQADSLHALVISQTKQADSLRHEALSLPASSAGPISTIARRLAGYTSPDTTRL